MSFHVGQRVVCVVQVKDAVRIDGANYPDKGTVYTVRAVRDDHRKDHEMTVLLSEIDNAHFVGVTIVGWGHGYLEPGFPESGFRPLDEKRLDIFRAMLVTPPKQEVRA